MVSIPSKSSLSFFESHLSHLYLIPDAALTTLLLQLTAGPSMKRPLLSSLELYWAGLGVLEEGVTEDGEEVRTQNEARKKVKRKNWGSQAWLLSHRGIHRKLICLSGG